MHTKIMAIQQKVLDTLREAKEELKKVLPNWADRSSPDFRTFNNESAKLLALLCLTRFNELIDNAAELRNYNELLKLDNYTNLLNGIGDNLRPTWEEYFMLIAMTVGLRASCYSRDVGAVIVKHKQIISTGYNGALKGLKSCLDDKQCHKENYKYNLTGINLNYFQDLKTESCTVVEQLAGPGLTPNEKILLENRLALLEKSETEIKTKIKIQADDQCRAYHAEANALGHLVNSSEKVEPSITQIYVTLYPCKKCAERIIDADIREVYFLNTYRSNTKDDVYQHETEKLFEEKGIKLKKVTIRPSTYLVFLFNFLHLEGPSRSLIKPNEYHFELDDFELCPSCG